MLRNVRMKKGNFESSVEIKNKMEIIIIFERLEMMI